MDPTDPQHCLNKVSEGTSGRKCVFYATLFVKNSKQGGLFFIAKNLPLP